MKKRVWTGILTAALVLSIGTTGALAAEPTSSYSADGSRASFVDANGDGICDNFSSGTCSGGYGSYCGGHGGRKVRVRKNSRCPGHICEDGSWAHCADTDGDGVCDSCGVTLPQGSGFVDADGDGICDHYSSGTCGGNYGGGHHRGGGCRR